MVTECGWTAQELDDLAGSGSFKGAIHMAAWRGSLENLEYLLDVGCDINLISQGLYSYGKTPLFFALTQNRDEVVRLLLERGAGVKVINNKGQSALSLATPSHVSAETRALIQQAETTVQANVPWVNYRATHSDGFDYGDLDPRFLDRPLRPTDVVEEFVVNPTTQETRKGGFSRLNKQKKEKRDELSSSNNNDDNNKSNKGGKKRDKQRQHIPLTLEEKQKREECWGTIQQVLSSANGMGDENGAAAVEDPSQPTTVVARSVDAVVKPLVTIVKIRDRQKMRWIQEEAERLEQTLQEAESDYFWSEGSHIPDEWVLCLKEREDVTPRQVSLVRRLLSIALRKAQRTALDDGGDHNADAHDALVDAASKTSRTVPQDLLLQAQGAVTGLSKELLQRSLSGLVHGSATEHLLALPRTPRWVDTVQDVRKLYDVLVVESEKEEQFCIGVDTEWHEDENGSPRVATLQIAIPSESSIGKNIDAWVLDMMPPSEESEYHSEMIKLVLWIFQQSESVVLGFSFGHDLPKLNAYLHHHTNRPYTPISMEKVVDIQIVAAYYCAAKEMRLTKSTMPGLKSTCARYLASAGDCNITYALDKKEQCSDWSQRPLRLSQLEYAGLDAGVLLVLLNAMSSELVPV
jgi:hypothetical protein